MSNSFQSIEKKKEIENNEENDFDHKKDSRREDSSSTWIICQMTSRIGLVKEMKQNNLTQRLAQLFRINGGLDSIVEQRTILFRKFRKRGERMGKTNNFNNFKDRK